MRRLYFLFAAHSLTLIGWPIVIRSGHACALSNSLGEFFANLKRLLVIRSVNPIQKILIKNLSFGWIKALAIRLILPSGEFILDSIWLLVNRGMRQQLSSHLAFGVDQKLDNCHDVKIFVSQTENLSCLKQNHFWIIESSISSIPT